VLGAGCARMVCPVMGCAVMRIPIAVFTLATGISSVTVAAPIEVALVENVVGAPAGVELMDYVETGKVIQLGARDGVVLSYMSSCVRETITGGTVTVGTDQSDVQGGRVTRSKVDCDGGNLVLSGGNPSQFAGRTVRGAASSISSADPKFVLYRPITAAGAENAGHAANRTP
jgi:hypothetical protein